MSETTRMLWWAEWRQRRTPFLICLAWMVCGAAYDVAYELSSGFRAPVASFYTTSSLLGQFMPIFLAMRTALGETTDRTRAFADALPVSVSRRAWIRLLGGAGALVVPIVVGAAVTSLCLAAGWIEQAPSRLEPHGPEYVSMLQRPGLDAITAVGMTWTTAAVVICSATSLYLILCLLGTALRVESHAGFLGAAVTAAWFLGGGLPELLKSLGRSATQVFWAFVPQAWIVNYGYGNENGGYGDLYFPVTLGVPLAINVLLQLGLAIWFARRYSRRVPRGVLSARQARPRQVWRWWSWPLPTRTLALAWLTMRQALPMALPGLAIACLMTPLQLDAVQVGPEVGLAARFADAMSSSTWIVGLLWAVVVGSGIFASELDTKLGEFWRAAPVRPRQLFAIKFLVGLIVVLGVLDATTIAVSWNSPRWGEYFAMNWPYIAVIVPLHATMYAIAVAWACWLRRPVVGGMAAIGTFTLMNVALEWSNATRDYSPIRVYTLLAHGRPLDFSAHGYPWAAMLMAMTLIAAALIGMRALARYSPLGRASL